MARSWHQETVSNLLSPVATGSQPKTKIPKNTELGHKPACDRTTMTTENVPKQGFGICIRPNISPNQEIRNSVTNNLYVGAKILSFIAMQTGSTIITDPGHVPHAYQTRLLDSHAWQNKCCAVYLLLRVKLLCYERSEAFDHPFHSGGYVTRYLFQPSDITVKWPS